MSEISAMEKYSESQRLLTIIEKALKGELHRDRALEPGEPQTLSSVHIGMVLDRVGENLTAVEIADKYDYTRVQVGHVLNHPDAQTIMSTIIAMQASHLTSMEARFAALAPEALNVQVDLMRNIQVAPVVRAKISGEILSRAGYGIRKQVDINDKRTPDVPVEALAGLGSILAESMRVGMVDYTQYTKKPDGEVIAAHLQIGSGQTSLTDGASPVAPPALQEPATPSISRVA